MKKAYSFRLSDETILAIRILQKELGLKSEGAAVESRFLAGSSKQDAGMVPDKTEPRDVGASPAPAAIPKDEKRAMFEALKAKLAGKPDVSGLAPDLLEPTKPLHDLPTPCFDFDMNGEPHRVRLMKFDRVLFHVGEDGENRLRPLAPGELERFWAKRTP